jgi:hypothetical protein
VFDNLIDPPNDPARIADVIACIAGVVLSVREVDDPSAVLNVSAARI